jgi:hypothetical protein
VRPLLDPPLPVGNSVSFSLNTRVNYTSSQIPSRSSSDSYITLHQCIQVENVVFGADTVFEFVVLIPYLRKDIGYWKLHGIMNDLGQYL